MGVFGVPQISGVSQIFGVPQKSGVVKSQFFGLKSEKKPPQIFGVSPDFWDCFGVEHGLSNILIFSVSSRRFWILLVSDVVTHTYNTSERSYSHGDVYKRVFYCVSCDL